MIIQEKENTCTCLIYKRTYMSQYMFFHRRRITEYTFRELNSIVDNPFPMAKRWVNH